MLSPSQQAAKRTIERLRAKTLPQQQRALTFDDLNVFSKEEAIVPLRLKRVQKHLLEHLTGRDIVLKARQMGISTAIQAHLFLEATRSPIRVVTMAHDDEGTTFLREMQRVFYDELPDELKPPRTTNNTTRTRYANTGSTMFSGTAGGTGQKGRAGSFSHFHGSEVAYWKDAQRLVAGAMQGVPIGYGSIIMESTANGQQGWFYERCMEALDPKARSPWKLHFYPWWWDEDYRLPVIEPLTLTDDERRLVDLHGLDYEQIAFRRFKQDELKHKFPQEYPEDVHSAFLASGQGYFILRNEMFDAPADATPQAGRVYVAGLDFGQANDYTVLSIVDATTGQQVHLLRINRLPWAEMRRQVIDLCIAWNVQLLVPEANSMGTTNIEALTTEMYDAGCSTNVLAFTTTLMSKTTLLSTLRLALEEGDLVLLPDPVQRREMSAFAGRQTASGVWQLSAPEGKHDDTVMATGLAWHGAGQMLTPNLDIDLSINW